VATLIHASKIITTALASWAMPMSRARFADTFKDAIHAFRNGPNSPVAGRDIGDAP
jgi:hypothetical protein